MANPFEDDDAQAEERIGKMQSELEAAKDKQVEPDQTETVDLDSFDEDLEPSTRQEKKRNRYREQLEARKAAEERAERLERELSEIKGHVTALRQQTPAPSGPPQANPYEQKLQELERQQDELNQAYLARSRDKDFTHDEYEKFRGRFSELQRQYHRVIAHEAQAANRPTREQQFISELQARHPDVWSDSRAVQYLSGEMQRRRALGYHGSLHELADEAADETRKALRMGRYRSGRQPATEEDKRRYSGVPSGNGAASSSSSSPNTVRLVGENAKRVKALAAARYPEIKDDQKRLVTYLNTLSPETRKLLNRGA